MILAVDGKVHMYDSNIEEVNLLLKELFGTKSDSKFNEVIEAFSADFYFIKNGMKTFSELDELYEDGNERLKQHMDLMDELDYLLRYGKACIVLMEEENDN